MASKKFRVACIQANASATPEHTVEQISGLVRASAAEGARLICTPEMSNMIEPRMEVLLTKTHTEKDDPSLASYRALAKELGVWLHVGSLAIRVPDSERLANRSFLLDPAGTVVGRYDKIHMFDVQLASGESYRESQRYRPGDQAQIVETPWGILGLTICYDLRFPDLYRQLAQAGAQLFVVPSAFSRATGEAHWHVLQRARAIENGCFVIAAAQCGEHEGGRRTYGHSLIVNPWGQVIAEAGEEVGFILADVDPQEVLEARRQIPSLHGGAAYRRPERSTPVFDGSSPTV